MNIYTIYKATNLINGKCYIGFDSRYPNRLRNHKMNHLKENNSAYKCAFYDALRKYGWENFSWEILYQSEHKNHTKNVMENFFICEHNSFGGFENSNGYNMTLGGEGSFGRPCSEKHKRILSKKQKEKFLDNNHKEKHSQAMKEWYKNLPEETKKEMARKASLRFIGNKLSLGTNRPRTEETKEKISKSLLGRIFTEETRKKIKEARKEKGCGERNGMSNPENRKKVGESKIGRKKYISLDTGKGKYCFPGQEPNGYILSSLK